MRKPVAHRKHLRATRIALLLPFTEGGRPIIHGDKSLFVFRLGTEDLWIEITPYEGKWLISRSENVMANYVPVTTVANFGEIPQTIKTLQLLGAI